MQVTDTAANIEAVQEFLDREQVHTVECMFADTWGVPRGKRLSVPHFCSVARGDGFAIANVAFTWDMHGVIFPTAFVNDDDWLPGHARRPGHLDPAPRRLEGRDRLLPVRHDRSGHG